jgi:hypothetical protein
LRCAGTLEEVLTAMLDGVVPALDDVPEDMRAELVEMTWWDDVRLIETADAAMPEEDQARMVELSTSGPSSPAEQEALEALRTDYGRITTLRRLRATRCSVSAAGSRFWLSPSLMHHPRRAVTPAPLEQRCHDSNHLTQERHGGGAPHGETA